MVSPAQAGAASVATEMASTASLQAAHTERIVGARSCVPLICILSPL
jgi:hypothetical protein